MYILFGRYMFDKEGATKIDPALQDALFMMVVANSCVNPIIYGRYTKKTLGKFICPCSQAILREPSAQVRASQNGDRMHRNRQRTSDLIAVTSVIWRLYAPSSRIEPSRFRRGVAYSTGSAGTTGNQIRNVTSMQNHPLMITRAERDTHPKQSLLGNSPRVGKGYDEVGDYFSIGKNDIELHVFNRDGP